jgi:hypothetical protein
VSAQSSVAESVEHFRQRVMQDALSEATAAYWRRRAEVFDWAKPRTGDFHGQASREELSARWRELHELAEACRNRARVAALGGEPW